MDKLKKDKLVLYWLKSARLDLESAKEIANNTNRYTSALFFLHLAIEKSLKAKFVALYSEYAPYSHNLLHLASKIPLNWSEQQAVLASEINEFNLESRYPDDLFSLEKKASKEFCLKYLKSGEELYLWISAQSNI